MREEDHVAMGKLAETIAKLRSAWRDPGRPNQDTEIQTGAVEDKDHRRDADPTLIAELDALEAERGRIQSLLMTGGTEGRRSDRVARRARRAAPPGPGRRRQLTAQATAHPPR